MAYFAKLNSDNVVMTVLKVDDADCLDSNNNESEAVGITFLQNSTGWTNWKQTSYNTKEGKHYSSDGNTLSETQNKAFRKNYAGIGYTYDSTKDAFIPPKPFSSWVLNETKCVYEAPVTYPSTTTYGPDSFYHISWNETDQRWEAFDEEDPVGNFVWNASTLNWDSA
jgi:hypothetical protein